MQRFVADLGRFGGLFLGLSQACCAAACLGPVLSAQTGIERSVWQEFSDQNQQLVREQGNLPFAALGTQLTCDWGTFALRGAVAQGVRDYSGVSNRGQALTTQSTLRNSELLLSYSYPINPQWEPYISAGISRSKRDIQSAGPVLGYLEEFQMFPVQLGIKWRPILFDSRLLLLAHAGSTFQPQVKVELPGRDALTLDLGRTLSAGVSAELELGQMARGQFVLATQWNSTRIARGTAGVVTRDGVPTGVAIQPRSQLTQTQLSILWRKSL
jgi:hypothetical protein